MSFYALCNVTWKQKLCLFSKPLSLGTYGGHVFSSASEIGHSGLLFIHELLAYIISASAPVFRVFTCVIYLFPAFLKAERNLKRSFRLKKYREGGKILSVPSSITTEKGRR